jgi:hypothetical protein
MNEIVKFKRWFVAPYDRLKDMDNGDGAFVILSMGIFLCERYFRTKSGCVTKQDLTDKFYRKASRAFDCDPELFERFWSIYRHGMQHRGQPQKWIKEWNRARTKKIKKRYGWSISDRYTYKPTQLKVGRKKVVCIYPNAFTEFVLSKFLSDPAALKKSIRHQFGDITPHP